MMYAHWRHLGGLATVVIACSWLMVGCVASVDTNVEEQDEALLDSSAEDEVDMTTDERSPQGMSVDPWKKGVNDEGLPLLSTNSGCDGCGWPPGPACLEQWAAH